MEGIITVDDRIVEYECNRVIVNEGRHRVVIENDRRVIIRSM